MHEDQAASCLGVLCLTKIWLPIKLVRQALAKLAGIKIIFLVIEKAKIRAAEKLAGDKPLLELLPFQPLKVGQVTTGSEVASGRI